MRFFPRNTLRVENFKDGHHFTLLNNWIVTCRKWGTQVIETGFYTDFASIPQCFHWIYPPVNYREEGTLHDYLYYAQEFAGRKITRKEADLALKDYVYQKTKSKTTAFNFYWAVRIGGLKAWNKYKKDGSKNED